jgi:hypothetical protein
MVHHSLGSTACAKPLWGSRPRELMACARFRGNLSWVDGDCDTGQVAADAADRFCGRLICGMDDV